MRKLLFLPVFFWINTLIAQNYQNICTPGITFFSDKSNSFIAFRRDSIVPTVVNDTIFISYRAIRSVSDTGCLDTTNGSILGRKIYKTHTGWFYLFNRTGDTVKINSQALLNQSWSFCPLPANGYIEATVTSIITDSVLGTPDVVKVITFQAKNAGNNNITHILNQKFIKLSQHNGLSLMLDVFSIPDDTIFYTLAGKSIPAIGVQNLTWQDIYNYNVGDIFHYTGYAINFVWSDFFEIVKVLGRTDYGSDSVKYIMEHCQKTLSGSYPFYSTVHDTIQSTYSFLEDPENKWLTRLPGEFIHASLYNADDYWFSTGDFQNRRMKGVNWGGFVYTWSWQWPGNDTCWRIADGYNATVSTGNFTEGLGRTRTYWFHSEPPVSYRFDENLVYYKKGSLTWGTPVSTDCAMLVGVDRKESEGNFVIRVIPNPAETEVQITVPGVNPDDYFLYSLYNYSGIKLLEGKVSSNPFILNRNGRSSGLYFLTISGRNGTVTGRTKIIYK